MQKVVGIKKTQIDTEMSFHGRNWSQVHQGYFSDRSIAQPFLQILQQNIQMVHPDVVADLGGGDGFILKELLKTNSPSDIAYVDVDLSMKQLGCIDNSCIKRLQSSLMDLSREHFPSNMNSLLCCMRSVLHYFGQDGLCPVLSHIRSILKPGEYFIHQTACFSNEIQAACLNQLYQQMHTVKWYPTKTTLQALLKQTGWRVEHISAAHCIRLNSMDLKKRYQVSEKDMDHINTDLFERFGEIQDIYKRTEQGFIACLPYTIFTCVAE